MPAGRNWLYVWCFERVAFYFFLMNNPESTNGAQWQLRSPSQSGRALDRHVNLLRAG